MTKKNLAKTIKEGKSTRSCWRSDPNRSFRRNEHQTLQDFVNHPGDPEDLFVEDKVFARNYSTVKIGPAIRFLKSNIGNPWHEVHTKIIEKLGNSVSGKMFLSEIILRYVNDTQSGTKNGRIKNPEVGELEYYNSFYKNRYFYVDSKGMLQSITNHVNKKHVDHDEFKDAVKFLDNRVIVKIGDNFHWCFPKTGIWKIDLAQVVSNFYVLPKPKLAIFKQEYGVCRKPYFSSDTGEIISYDSYVDFNWQEKSFVEGFVPRSQMSAKDLETFNKFSFHMKNLILDLSKGI